ncbi:MAG: nucleoside monophosphate kinase [Patescibacteria group bacterium]
MNPITVALFGISGSGKGTQADLLERYLADKDPSRKIVRAEMGALARAFMTSGTSLAKRAERIVSSGGLLPSFIPIYLLTDVINRSFEGDEHLILDGTCRKPFQSMVANEIAEFYGRTEKHAIMLTLSKDTARARLLSRGRHDDATDAALERRFAWFEKDVVPAFDTLRECGWTVHEIDGGADIATVHAKTLAALGVVQ